MTYKDIANSVVSLVTLTLGRTYLFRQYAGTRVSEFIQSTC